MVAHVRKPDTGETATERSGVQGYPEFKVSVGLRKEISIFLSFTCLHTVHTCGIDVEFLEMKPK